MINNIDKFINERALKRNNLLLLSKEHSIELINSTFLKHIELLGIDAFYFHGKYIQPDMEFSLDFADEHFRNLIYDEKIKLILEKINKASDNYYFEFVYE